MSNGSHIDDHHEEKEILLSPAIAYLGDLDMNYGSSLLDIQAPGPPVRSKPRETSSQTFPATRYLQETRQHNEKLHEQIVAKRSRLREERAELRRLEEAIAIADDQLIRFVNKEVSNFMGNKDLLQKLEELQLHSQSLRDEVGPRDVKYQQMEEDLEQAEDKLSQREDRFYNYLNNVPDKDPLWTRGWPISSGGWGTPSAASSVSSSPVEYQPLLADFLNSLGDLNILKERYEALCTERDRLQDQQLIRQFANISLNSEDQGFLIDFPAATKKLHSDITQLQRKCDKLQEECLAAGFLGVNSTDSSSEDSQSSNSQSYHDQHLSPPMDQNIEPDYLSTSMSKPIKPNAVTQLSQSQVSLLKVSKSENRMNKWMLKKLNASLMEVILLAVCWDMSQIVRNGWLENALGHRCDDFTTSVIVSESVRNSLLKLSLEYWRKDDTGQAIRINRKTAFHGSVIVSGQGISTSLALAPESIVSQDQSERESDQSDSLEFRDWDFQGWHFQFDF